jgi:hypothetical protein
MHHCKPYFPIREELDLNPSNIDTVKSFVRGHFLLLLENTGSPKGFAEDSTHRIGRADFAEQRPTSGRAERSVPPRAVGTSPRWSQYASSLLVKPQPVMRRHGYRWRRQFGAAVSGLAQVLISPSGMMATQPAHQLSKINSKFNIRLYVTAAEKKIPDQRLEKNHGFTLRNNSPGTANFDNRWRGH